MATPNIFHRFIAGIIKPFLGISGKKAVPPMDGKLEMDGLQDVVSIVRDGSGIPHVKCKNVNDAHMALGYLHASERLWQMELFRRLSSGSMCAFFGKDALPIDRCVRTLGFSKIAEADLELCKKEDPSSIDATEVYLSGVNFCINKMKLEGKLPIEFTLLGKIPELWTVLDTFAFARILSVQMGYGGFSKLVQYLTEETVGKEAAAELNLETVSNMSDGLEIPVPGIGEAISGAKQVLETVLEKVTDGGSNCWAVSGSKTATGTCLLANDMHLGFATPVLFYPVHMKVDSETEPYHSFGNSIPANPVFMLSGHNEDIGYGITLAFSDQEDIFIEKFVSDTEYEYKGETLKCEVREENILIDGEDPVIHRVLSTVHGPIISDEFGSPKFKEATKSAKLALSSVLLEPQLILTAFSMASKAKSFAEFRQALSLAKSPSLNILYCDVKGNIGRVHLGTVPKRPEGKCHNTILPGWTGEYDWQGLVPTTEMPFCLNPDCGYTVSANSKIVNDENFGHDLGKMTRPAFRANRIKELIVNTEEKFTVEMFQEWQMDSMCIAGRDIAKELQNIDLGTSEAAPLLAELQSWDGQITSQCIAAVIFRNWALDFIDNLLSHAKSEKSLDSIKDEIRGSGIDVLVKSLSARASHEAALTLYLLRKGNDSIWIKWAGGVEEAVKDSLLKTKASLKLIAGGNMRKWTPERLWRTKLDHSFSLKPIMGAIFNMEPLPSPCGTEDTLCYMGPHVPVKQNSSESMLMSDGAVIRGVLDPSNWDNSTSVLSTGVSGHRWSPHYDDQYYAWLKGKQFPMHWSDAAVEKATVHRFELNPVRDGTAVI